MFISEQGVSMLHYVKDRKIFRMLFEVESYLNVVAQKKLMYLSLTYHEKENTGNKIIKIEKGITKIMDLIGNLSWEVVPTIIQLSITLLVLFIVDWRFGLSFLMFAPVFVFITVYSNKVVYPLRKKRYKQYEEASGKLGQSIININTVKSFVQEQRETKEFRTLRENIRDKGICEWFRLLNYWIYRNFIIDAGRAVILLLGVYLVCRGAVTIGTLVFVVTLSEKSYFSLYRLSRFYDRIEEGNIAVNRFISVTEQTTDIINPHKGLKPKKIVGQIEFQEVNYTYDDAKNKALNNVNIKINSGCITALVGPSGGGKTTVARMIYRHYDPQKGQILIDNKKLTDYDLYAYRKFVAIVPQEVEIFNSSVKDNICYARPRASFKEVQAAARIANAEEFIFKLNKKYDTEVGERGVKLSGGQRQRIGIARAILANPRILIFDEATSNLDSYSEKLIQEAMDKVSKGRTVIIIAHRFSTIKKANKIIVLEEGQVVEEGSHLELTQSKGGLYAKLIKLQEMGDVE